MKISKIWRKITNNLPAKLLALALASLLYWSNQMLSLENKSFSIPITLQETGDMVVTNTLPSSVRVRLKSTQDNISSVFASDIKIQLDTREYFESGRYDIPLELIPASSIIALDPLEIEIIPKTISVHLEKRVADSIPLAPNYTGECAEGYEVSSVEFEPKFVQVSGAENAVSATKAIFVDKINLEGKKDSFYKNVSIQNFSNALNIESPKTITAHVVIKPIYQTKTFSNIPIQKGGLPQNLVVKEMLPSISIDLYGRKLDIETYKASFIAVHADYTQVTNPGTYEIPLRIFVSERFKVMNITPSKITVTVDQNLELENSDNN